MMEVLLLCVMCVMLFGFNLLVCFRFLCSTVCFYVFLGFLYYCCVFCILLLLFSVAALCVK